MGDNEHIEDYRPDLPPEAGANSRLGFQINHEWFKEADSEMRHEAMRAWFLSRYCDPANETPYNGREGGYLYIYGGPYDASEQLNDQFGGVVSDGDIQAVVDDVEVDGILEWAPIQTEPDYDEEFQAEVIRCTDPLLFFNQRLGEVDALKTLDADYQQQPLLLQLLYSSLITALETYLEDTMSFWVEVDNKVLRKFVANCQEFKKQKLQLSEIFDRIDLLQDEVENYLKQLIWHRLDKIIPLMSDSKLAALVPPPRLNLTRLYGVFAPNANVRAEVTTSQRGKNRPRLAEHLVDSDNPYHARSMSWAQRLKRVFNIDITQCEVCEKFNVKIIACITEASVINKILSYLDKQNLPEADNDSLMPPLRAPPDVAPCSDYIIQHDFGFAGSVTDA